MTAVAMDKAAMGGVTESVVPGRSRVAVAMAITRRRFGSAAEPPRTLTTAGPLAAAMAAAVLVAVARFTAVAVAAVATST